MLFKDHFPSHTSAGQVCLHNTWQENGKSTVREEDGVLGAQHTEVEFRHKAGRKPVLTLSMEWHEVAWPYSYVKDHSVHVR